MPALCIARDWLATGPTYESPEHKEDADHDPGLYSCQSLGFGNVGGDGVEYVDQNKENCDQKCHPARHNVRRDEEGDPADNDEHSWRQIAGDDVVWDLPLERHLEARHRVVPGDGDVVLLLLRKFSDLDGVVEHGANLGVRSDELVNKHHLAVVVVEGSNLIGR